VRLLLDEMISPRVAHALRDSGYDVAAVAEDVNLRAMPDDVLLDVAANAGRILVTRNIADFARLHEQWHLEGKQHHGIVMVTGQAFPQNRSFVGAIIASLATSEHVLELAATGEVVFLRGVPS
jgi:predicted nuclease of predicted toxin-antitoxin system